MSPRTEQELLDATIDLATLRGWLVHHDRPARRANGWTTAIQGHAGFPDLVLARDGVVLLRELKGYDRAGRLGRLTPDQRAWQLQLGDTFAVWTPDDWDVIVATLTAKTPAKEPA